MTEFTAASTSSGCKKASSPYWLDAKEDEAVRELRTTPELPLHDVQDIVIIGGGMTGVSAAYHCMQSLRASPPSKPFRCLLLEKGPLSAGATGRNGGFICPGTSEKYSDSCARYGKEATKALFEFTVAGTDIVKDFMEKSEDSNSTTLEKCEMRFNGCVSVAITASELHDLKESYEFMLDNDIGVEWWDAETCERNTKSSSYLGGLFKPYGGNLWAARVVFTAALAAIKLSSEISGDHDSLNIQTNTNVTSTTRKPTEEELEHAGGFEGSADHLVAVHTNRGTVLARKVLHATNAWSSSLIPQLHGVLTPVRNQVIITKPVPLMWNFGLGANYGYEYFMQRPDGRIILGGMRDLSPTKGENSVDQEYLDTNISEALATYLPRHFPTDLSGVEVEKEWVGVLAFTPDRNPLVGSLAGEAFANQYIASGYSGHGMPLAFLVGKHISQCMMASLCDGGVEGQTISSNGCIPIAFSPARYGI